ncbi:MAG TPA: LysR family transcriptional regulator [Polyangia bacterium]
MQRLDEDARLEEMVAFATAAERGSFTRAAATLGRDATAISRRVQALERRLGVRLLERTTRRIAVTEAGRLFLERVRSVLVAIADAEDEVSSHAGGPPRGTLRLALPATFGRMWIAPLLADFLAAHPQVKVEAALSERAVDLVGEGFDAAIRLGALGASNLVARKLAPRRRLLCAAPAYVARHGRPSAPAELEAHACLAFSGYASHPYWRLTNAKGQRASVRARGPLVADDAEALVEAAVRGAGVVMCSDWLVGRQLRDGRLVSILDAWNIDDEGAIYAVVASKRLLPAKTRAFVSWIAAQLAPVPPWRSVRK